eukprot:TRINITY_DN2753_c0_g1_i2.p1 TRINITY_DN2753_c0_g1~~TRINITY_DN2753_c0_g1_i2.p1  ORF type:complete len:189 (-),score=57.42 TRINITY_DN2753_c0_g1_i2:32-598(-)
MIKAKIKERKQAAAAAEEISMGEREKYRRMQGKEAQEAQEARRKMLAEKAIRDKKRAQEKDRLAKERIRAQIEQDRLNRLANNGRLVPNQPEVSVPPTPASSKPPTVDPARSAATCVVQFRFKDGSSMKASFGADDTLSSVALHLVGLGKTVTKFLTTFPRKDYSGAVLDTTTLRAAGVVPRGVLIVE